MLAKDIKWLHVEASSRCNAKCPSCPRFIEDAVMNPLLQETDLDTDKFKNILDNFHNLVCIQFNGNHGDPIMAKNIIELIELAKTKCDKIQLHTNGSLRNSKWWADFGALLKDINHEVYFGIDGFEDTHHLYRRNTLYNKIIENAKSFIANGGKATWFFIPFEHNEHQIKSALQLSKNLGFKRFELYKGYRQNNPETIKNLQTGQIIYLKPPKILSNIKSAIVKQTDKKQVDIKNCMHYNLKSIYISADGQLSYCCYYMSLGSSTQIYFDSINELFNNTIDLSTKHCIKNCG